VSPARKNVKRWSISGQRMVVVDGIMSAVPKPSASCHSLQGVPRHREPYVCPRATNRTTWVALNLTLGFRPRNDYDGQQGARGSPRAPCHNDTHVANVGIAR
jgi:hypothetical protein